MFTPLYWSNTKHRKKISIPFANTSLRITRRSNSDKDHIVEVSIDTIVDNNASEPIDINILHRAEVEMKGCSDVWEGNSSDYYTRLFNEAYGFLKRGATLKRSRGFGLGDREPQILDLQEVLAQSDGMPAVPDNGTRPYSSFKVSVPEKQLTTFRVMFVVKGESYLRLVNMWLGTSPQYKFYDGSGVRSAIESMDLRVNDKRPEYSNFYEGNIKDSVIVPKRYNVIAVDYATGPNLPPLVPLRETDCIELDPVRDRRFSADNEPKMRYHFFQMKNPADFKIKLLAVKQDK